jgi:hypothetical protein
MADISLPVIKPGQRCVISGRTGMGKSTLGCWFLNTSAQHWIILNPKHTAAYADLPNSKILTKFDPNSVSKSILEYRYTIINFEGEQAEWDYMDEVLQFVHSGFENIGVCVDELYTLHSPGGRAGAGLVGLLTRGRELKQSFLGLTQRPAFVSRFVFSESDYIVAMDLILKDDRKRLYENTGNEHFMGRLEPRRWLFYDVTRDLVAKFGPVPPVKRG